MELHTSFSDILVCVTALASRRKSQPGTNCGRRTQILRASFDSGAGDEGEHNLMPGIEDGRDCEMRRRGCTINA